MVDKMRRLCWMALLVLIGPSVSLAADPNESRLEAFRNRPPSEKFGTPRQTIETLCFSMDAYDRKQTGMMADAVACLEIDPRDGVEAGGAELLAIGLEEILDELSLPFHTLLGGAEGKPFVFHEEPGLRIVLAQGKDGLWRFDRETVAKVPAMQRLIAARAKSRTAKGSTLREGMEDPTATFMSFLKHAIAEDFESAALRLDLSELTPEQRRLRGPHLAWQLACVIQRRGYVYSQDVADDPDGAPYTWSADMNGRITVERVPQPGGKDTWLFTRGTVAAIETMWRKIQDKPPDVRYLLLKTVVPPTPSEPPTAGASGGKPESVPDDFGSPRSMLHAFFRALDEAEFNDAVLEDACTFLDLRQFPPEDLKLIGPKRLGMLEAILRKLKPDVSSLSDRWSAPPQVLSGPGGLRVDIVRQADGCWRFSSETVARLPAMYELLGGREKADDERLHGLGNPRECLIGFLNAIDVRDDARAARCLDLSEIPPSARDNVGPVLAFKLKYTLDRLGRVYPQEVPTDPDGPRLVLYRGPVGRIVLARREDESTGKIWGFTTSTVRQIESMFERVLDEPPNAALPSFARVKPEFLLEPGIWLRLHTPVTLRAPLLGLQAYQWLGLLLAIVLAVGAAFLVRRIALWLLLWFFHLGAAAAERDALRHKLRSLQTLAFVLVIYELFELVDMPAALAAHIYVLQKVVLTVALTWALFQGTDLVCLFYKHSEQLSPHRGLGDLLVPFSATMVKLAIVVASLIYLVYQFGQGESLTRFLAGLGIAGLAVSLAAQDSLKNLFGTLLIIGDRTFRIGDRLLIGDKEGVVEQVGFRSTKLRTPEDSLLVLPNALLASGIVDNMGLRVYRRVRLYFYIAVRTPLQQAQDVRDAVRAYLSAQPAVDPNRVLVHLQRIGETGIELEVSAYFEAKDLAAEKKACEALTCEVLRIAQARTVEIMTAKKT